VFAYSGYAVFRTWEPRAESRYLFVDFSPQRHSHGHLDALSFFYFDRGVPWIVDSGGPYRYDASPGRAYVLSSSAHNVCQVRGRGQVDGESRLVSATEIDGGMQIDLETWTDGAGVGHRRAIKLDADGELTVFDRFAAPEPLAVECFLHLEPGTTVEVRDGGRVRARRGDGDLLDLRFEAVGGPLDVRVVEGQESPRQGWLSPDDGNLVPAPTIVYSTEGKDPALTAIGAGAAGTPP